MRTATTKAIKAARDAGRIKPWHEPSVAIAIKLSAALSGPKLAIAELIRLSESLDKVMARLPLAETTTSDGGSGDGPTPPTPSAGPGDAHPVGLAAGVGAGPEVGDTALPK